MLLTIVLILDPKLKINFVMYYFYTIYKENRENMVTKGKWYLRNMYNVYSQSVVKPMAKRSVSNKPSVGIENLSNVYPIKGLSKRM